MSDEQFWNAVDRFKARAVKYLKEQGGSNENVEDLRD